MRRKLWQRLVVWFGLRYNRWPKSWVDASDVTWTSITDGLIDHKWWHDSPIAPNSGDITIMPEAFDE